MSTLFEKGLPANVEAERLVLGAVLLDDSAFVSVAAALTAADFCLERHRRIFRRMWEMHERREHIDRVTVANALMRFRELESCGGLSYLVSLDDGLPHIPNIDSYVQIIKDKAALRQIVFASQHLTHRCLMGEEGPDEILEGAEETLLRLGEARASRGLTSPRQILDEYPGGISAFLDPSQRVPALSTGFTRLDEKTGGLYGGELCILAARPSMGKTALALNIAQHLAERLKHPVAIFSLEMSKESLLTRLLCAMARVNSRKFRAGYLSAEEAQAAVGRLRSGRCAVVHRRYRRHPRAGYARQATPVAESARLALVIVDYLQLMTARGRFENRNQEVTCLSRGLKLLAKELKVPVLALSQLSRAPEMRPGDHRPQLSDLRESGSIEQDADLVAFLYREEVYKPQDESLRGCAELIVAKQRNGPVGKVELVFLEGFTKFENRAQDSEGEENR